MPLKFVRYTNHIKRQEKNLTGPNRQKCWSDVIRTKKHVTFTATAEVITAGQTNGSVCRRTVSLSRRTPLRSCRIRDSDHFRHRAAPYCMRITDAEQDRRLRSAGEWIAST